MGLLIPDPGLVFWMVVVFGIVFFVLAKFGFPVIIQMVDKRKAYIEDSLKSAREANKRLAEIRVESEKILTQAHNEQAEILKNAAETRNRIISEAKEQARMESDRMMEEVKKQIATEKDSALLDIRRQVAVLSVGIAEKVMRNQLSDEKEQTELISRLMDEMTKSSK